MLSDELKKKISELNRREINVFPLSETSRLKNEPAVSKEMNIEEALNGEVYENEGGVFFRIKKSLKELIEDSEQFICYYRYIFKAGGYSGNLEMLHPDMKKFFNLDCEQALFLDLETCGLTNSPLFLVGIMYFKDNDFISEQLLARDYTEEEAVIVYLEEVMQNFSLLVTFNGKSFDYPYLRERGLLYNVRFDPYFQHVDILHESRRRWKEHLPNCKLGTLERHILKRRRIGDIPGDQIPDAYHEFVRTGRLVKLKAIINHNLLDLVSMGELLLYIFTK